MKKVIIIAGIVSLALSACNTSKLVTYSDDIYANPSEERLEKARLAAEKKKKEEELAKKEAEERAAALAAQKAIDDANPAYKDPVYDKDDYYDYQYASRIRRFDNPVNGVGYYDNYYTNYYWYNGNPGMYGTSIYSSYNYWGPSYSNYNCWPSSYFGVSYGWGSPNYGYNPYGGWGNPYGGGWGNPYSNAYWQGYYNGYNNGFYNGYYGYPYGGYNYYGNGWGYYNQFDVNSAYNKPTNAPRGSHDGGNSGRTSNPGLANNGLVQKYVQEVQVAQAMTPKFDKDLRSTKSKNNFDNTNNNQATFENYNPNDVRPNSGSSNPKNNINSGNTNDVNFNNGNTPSYTTPKSTINSGNNNDVQYNTPPKTNVYTPNSGNEPIKPSKNNNIENTKPKGNIFDSGSPTFNNGGGNKPTPSGNTPRGGGSDGGGTKRPR